MLYVNMGNINVATLFPDEHFDYKLLITCQIDRGHNFYIL